MKAKKSLGQHFLKSEKALAQIVAAGNLGADDVVLEIGPGEGVLTERLLARVKKVVAIEKDRELIPLLQDKFSNEIRSKKLELIEGDILKLDLSSNLSLAKYKLVANIPYYITGAIIERFLSADRQPSTMVLLIQKEVAERIVAKDGKESVLSIAVKAYGVPRLVAKVPAGAFSPAPAVDSAVIAIEAISKDFFKSVEEQKFFALLKGIFGKKRKQLAGSLSDFLGNRARAASLLAELSIGEKVRPEELSVAQWKMLAEKISSDRS